MKSHWNWRNNRKYRTINRPLSAPKNGHKAHGIWKLKTTSKNVNDRREQVLNKLKELNTDAPELVLKALEAYCEVIIKSMLKEDG